MIVALVLSLGVLNASSPGLASFASPRQLRPPVLLGQRIVLAEVHSTTVPGLPGAAGRDGWNEADSNEEDDELVAFWLIPTSTVMNPAAAMPRRDHLAAARRLTGGLLHELHGSWQLRC
jgi:hypothetical protein